MQALFSRWCRSCSVAGGETDVAAAEGAGALAFVTGAVLGARAAARTVEQLELNVQ